MPRVKEKLTHTAESVPTYKTMLKAAVESKVPFRVGGTFAISSYTGVNRQTKDLDIFCRPGDNVRLLQYFKSKGYETSVPDERWLGKIKKNGYTCDVIFGLANAIVPVNDEWFRESHHAEIFGVKVDLLSPTELFWAKVFVQDRYKNDMADIMHLILCAHKKIDWKRLLSHMEAYWEMLLICVLYFRFVYPSEREAIPKWLVDELLRRLDHQLTVSSPQKHMCRGRLMSRGEYEIDIKEWGFEDLTA